MKLKHLLPAAILPSVLAFSACDDNISQIGGSLVDGELNITVDSTEYDLMATTYFSDRFDARSASHLIGNIQTDDYGTLACAFVAQLMPAARLNIPDSIPADRVDSIQIILSVKRGELTGDSLAPQRLRIYPLDRQLPADITNSFNPDGYYNPQNPLGSATYTLSTIGTPDSAKIKSKDIRIRAELPRQWGIDIINAYRSGSTVFEWPSTFASRFPGVYVEPVFGNGCIANVSKLIFQIYYHRLAEVTSVVDDQTVTKQQHFRDSVAVFATAPEVLCSNIISYTASPSLKAMVEQGRSIMTTPGGYLTRIKFPTRELVKKFDESKHNMSSIGNLSFTLPASPVRNSLGITAAPNLLLVKTSELDEFFANNSLPDSNTSFWASYDSASGCYRFSSMRNYILKILEQGNVTDEDCDFTLVPVNLTTETNKNEYTGQTTVYVVSCTPYLAKPTMTQLETGRAMICFTFSSQKID